MEERIKGKVRIVSDPIMALSCICHMGGFPEYNQWGPKSSSKTTYTTYWSQTGLGKKTLLKPPQTISHYPKYAKTMGGGDTKISDTTVVPAPCISKFD